MVSKLLDSGPSLGFPGLNLSLSQFSVPEGTTVNVTCAAGARVQVMLDGVPATAPGQPVQLQLNATENDDRHSFFCSAILEVDGEFLHKNTSVQLHVLYGPKIDTAKRPQSLMWKERPIYVLQCQARGNPDPQCLQEGSSQQVPVGTPFLVKLNHRGTYYLQATTLRIHTT
ncbi:intercellular adhesion molecule 3 [Talpa occidentalis]|uniref:intercellular adhesion molecule 3 n=1 Tax=Talpa occidentalis TaxID=50954 RepID=UPI0023F9DE2C|nr:intercellular adhesion molecule 3 [Talpa occidentalis]